MTLATIEQPPPAWVSVVDHAARFAEIIANTEFVPTSMRGKVDVVTACIMYGDAVGLHPSVALQSIHVIEGKPAPSAELCRALVFAAGHTIIVRESTGTSCRVEGQRAGRPIDERVSVTWNLDMARAAGLLGRQVWQRYPRAMLLARATSDLARMIFPDVVKGLGYIAETAASIDSLESWPIDEDEQQPRAKRPRTVGRKSTPARAALERPQPPAEALPDDRPPIAPPDEPEALTDEISRPVDPGYLAAGDVPHSQTLDRDFEPIASRPQPLADAVDEQRQTVGLEDVPLPSMPDLEPEQPIAEPTRSAQVGGGQLKALHKVLRDVLGPGATSDDRHALLGAILGKTISDTGKITRAEAGRTLLALDRIESGADVIVMGDDGGITIRAVESDSEIDDSDDDGMFPEPERQHRPTGRRDWDAP